MFWTQKKHTQSVHCLRRVGNAHNLSGFFLFFYAQGLPQVIINLTNRPLHYVMIIRWSGVFWRTRCTHERLPSSAMLLWPLCFLPAGDHVSCLAYPCSYSRQQLLSLTLFGQVFSLYLLSPGGRAPTITSLPHLNLCIGMCFNPLVSSQCHCASAGHWIYAKWGPRWLACGGAKELLYFHMKATSWNKVQHQSKRLMYVLLWCLCSLLLWEKLGGRKKGSGDKHYLIYPCIWYSTFWDTVIDVAILV